MTITNARKAAWLLTIFLMLFCLLGASAQSPDPHANETKAQHDARMKWWREARFGLFIHWGLYSVPAGRYQDKPVSGLGEWIMRNAKIPVPEYTGYADQFDPEQFNAAEWVSYAKAAGMKYIVMTAKHHEGFAMFPTAVDDYHIGAHTAFKRDPIGEMAAACQKAGLKFGVYYSQNLDWHHPGGGTFGPAWDTGQAGDFDTYIKTVAAPQVAELITRYHPAVLWWDIPAKFTPDQVRALTASFPNDPELIYNNRLGGGVPGDTETPEQHIPATGYKNRDWETCMTINDTWGFKSGDTNFKSSQTLLRNLIDIASKGGNYLLNVGPTSQGIIPAPEVQRLRDMGAWIKLNGDSIYATGTSPYRTLPFNGRATVKGNTLYLHVFDWPASGLTLSGLQTPVKSAQALATGQKLAVTKAADGTLAIAKPDKLDPVSTTIALTLSAPPVVSDASIALTPQPDGSYRLMAADADLAGGLKTEGSGLSNVTTNIGYWIDVKDTASWTILGPHSEVGNPIDDCQIQLVYACDPASAGSTFRIDIDGQPSGITGKVAATKSWTDYQILTLDNFFKLSSGTHVIQIVPLTKPGLAVMNLRRLTLIDEIHHVY